MTGHLILEDISLIDPAVACLTITKSGFIALSVSAVSLMVSPFLKDEPSKFIFIMSAPSLLAAISKDIRVLVEGSKNKLIIVLPFRIGTALSFSLLLYLNNFAVLIIELISCTDKSLID